MFCHLENLVVLNAMVDTAALVGFWCGILGFHEMSIVLFSAKMPLHRKPAALSRSSTFD